MTRPARIPADVHRPDRVVGPLTARQAAILAGTAATLYLLWTLTQQVVGLVVFLAVAVPVGVLATVITLGQRDGLTLDRLLIAAIRHRLHPPAPNQPLPHGSAEGDGVPEWISARTTTSTTTQTTTDEQPPPLSSGRRPSGFPARAISPARSPAPDEQARGGVGVVDLGGDGLVVVAVVSTVNFGLRTPAEQDGLVAGFARYLHALGGPVQILIRALPVDLDGHLQQLHTQIRHLPHPALAAAAHDHLQHLTRLAHLDGDDQLLARQVLLVLRERHRTADHHPADRHPADGDPAGRGQDGHRRLRGGAGEHRLLRRLHDAAMLLAPLDLTVTALTAAQTTALLTHTCNPDHPSPPHDRRRGDADSHRIVRAAAPAAGDDRVGRRDENHHRPDGYPYDTDPDDTDPDIGYHDTGDEAGSTADWDGANGDGSGGRWGPEQWAADPPPQWTAPPGRRPARRPHPASATPRGSQ